MEPVMSGCTSISRRQMTSKGGEMDSRAAPVKKYRPSGNLRWGQSQGGEQTSADSTKALKQSKKRTYTQLHLDFGQKDFSSVVCKDCGMRYTPGSAKDEQLHQKFHNSSINPSISFKPGKQDGLLFEDDQERKIFQLATSLSDAKKHKSMKALVSVIERDFQSSVLELLDKDQRVYLCVKRGVVVGCVVLERIQTAFLAKCAESSDGEMQFERTGDERRADCGVVLLWVAPKHRRQSVATLLLDVARCHFLFGYTVSKRRLAFYQPSTKGQQFASKYTNGEFLVY